MLSMKINTVLVLGSCFLATAGYSASYDCTRAATKVENLICGDPLLSKDDETLGISYKQRLKEADNQEGVREQQNEWLRNARNRCADLPCLRSAYATRIAQLKAMVPHVGIGLYYFYRTDDTG